MVSQQPQIVSYIMGCLSFLEWPQPIREESDGTRAQSFLLNAGAKVYLMCNLCLGWQSPLLGWQTLCQVGITVHQQSLPSPASLFFLSHCTLHFPLPTTLFAILTPSLC